MSEEQAVYIANRDGVRAVDAQPITGAVPLVRLDTLYVEVCLRAERIMAETGTVTGAHWNALRRICAEAGALDAAEARLRAVERDR